MCLKFENLRKIVFGRSGLNSSVFEKLFISYSCILFIKQCALRIFCIKMLYFSKKLIFPNFQPIELVARSIKIAIKILVWPIFFFMHHFYLGFTCFALFFFCIHLAVLQSYLSLFWHITCIHFAKLGTQLDLKIDWLIFESFVHSSICYFHVWTVENYFLKRYNG